MRNALLSIAMSPVLLAQGIMTRRRVPRLPEPAGARRGSTGTGPTLRLLIAGDSAAAGVGAPHQEQALCGRLVSELAESFAVEWRLEARTGATTRSAIEHLSAMPDARFDVALVSLGVNDVTGNVRPGKWRRQQAALRSLLRARFGVALLICSGLPPMHGFPALPQPLRWYLGWRASRFDQILREDLAGQPGLCFLDQRTTGDVSAMAADGFHPGPMLYREWGRRAGALIKDHFLQ